MIHTATRKWREALLVAMLVAAGCSGGGDDDGGVAADAASDAVEADAGTVEGDDSDDGGGGAGSAEAPADLPAECESAPIDIEVTIDSMPDYSAGTFEVASAVGVATPIVPNGDGSLDDLEPSELTEMGADTDLLLYTQWIGDHPFGRDDVGLFSGPEPPPGSVTFALSVVPTTTDGLAVGDVVSSSDEIAFDAITTFGTVGVYFEPPEGVETFFLVDNLDEAQGGTVEILHVDDRWLCARWDLAGETSNPVGTYSLSGVVLSELERATTPFT